MSFLDRITVEEKEKNEEENRSEFVFGGFPNTLGTTIGNFFRRVAITYLPGVSLCGVKIDDKNGSIKTKFSPISGVDKITFSLILSLKELIFEENGEFNIGDFFIFELDLKSENDEINVKGSDFVGKDIDGKESDVVLIKNKDLVLFCLSPNSNIRIKLFCRKNIGYLPERKQEKTIINKFEKEESIVVLDTDYCPIKSDNIFPKVEKVVTSLIDEEERLSLFIKTNGSITPKKALKETIDLSLKMFEIINDKIKKNNIKI